MKPLPQKARQTKRKLRRCIRPERALNPILTRAYRPWFNSLDLDLPHVQREAIAGHLGALLWHCCACRPGLIVELGVRRGLTTSLFIEAARTYGGHILSVDSGPVPFTSSYEQWFFKEMSSQEAGKQFPEIASQLGLSSSVDLVFLDTSHEYEDTVEELAQWVPHIAPTGTLICHDTAMGRVYRHSDGSIRRGRDNARGVERALEDFLGISLDARSHYTGYSGGWAVYHNPLSSGLTMLTRLGSEPGQG